MSHLQRYFANKSHLRSSPIASNFLNFAKIIAATISATTKPATTIPTIPPMDNTPLGVVIGGNTTLGVVSGDHTTLEGLLDMVALFGRRESVKA